MKKTKLVLGNAGIAQDDAITLDANPEHKPDVIHDLNITPLPFKDDQFNEIVCHHVLEHLKDLPAIMNELHRICDSKGTICIEVPHHTSWCANTPEHKLSFNYFAFDGYVEGGITRWMRIKNKFKLLSKEITFHRSFRKFFLHRLFNKAPMAYERFWAYIIPAENFKVRLRPIKKGECE